MKLIPLSESNFFLSLRLRLLLQQLDNGDMPSVGELQKTLSFAADVLSHQNGEEKRSECILVIVDQHTHTHSDTQIHAHTHTHTHTHPSHTHTPHSGEDKLLWVRDKQVRAWLSTTFTTKDSRYLIKTHALQPRERFKAVANTIMISNFMGR